MSVTISEHKTSKLSHFDFGATPRRFVPDVKLRSKWQAINISNVTDLHLSI